MKIKFVLGLILASFAVALIGCGDEKSSEPTPETAKQRNKTEESTGG
jgi:hypothetical protein